MMARCPLRDSIAKMSVGCLKGSLLLDDGEMFEVLSRCLLNVSRVHRCLMMERCLRFCQDVC